MFDTILTLECDGVLLHGTLRNNPYCAPEKMRNNPYCAPENAQ
jgi:hypothetical protein